MRSAHPSKRIASFAGVACLLIAVSYGEAPSALFPDLSHFKLDLPLDEEGKDYNGVEYENRDQAPSQKCGGQNSQRLRSPPSLSQLFLRF